MRLLAPAQPVVELGHDAAADRRAELAERAGPLGNGDGEQRFARFAELGALGDEAQAIEVHVRAAQHRDEPLVAHAVRAPPTSSVPPRASAPAGSITVRVSSKMSLMAAQTSSLVTRTISLDRLLHDRERPLADFAHRDAVGENADVIELDAAARGERLVHRVGFERLDANDLHLRPDRLDVAGDAGDEPAAAHRHEHRRDAVLGVAQNLVADRALSRR